MNDDGNQKPNPTPPQGWRDLAEQASIEQDGEKLSQLVDDLCDQLDHEDERRNPKPAKPGTSPSQRRL